MYPKDRLTAGGLRCCHTEEVAEATVVGSEKKGRDQKRSGPMLLGIKAVEGDWDRYDPWKGRSGSERLVGGSERAGWDDGGEGKSGRKANGGDNRKPDGRGCVVVREVFMQNAKKE
jgi:hypothetical protein